MSELRRLLLCELNRIDGLEARPSRVAGGMALFFRDKEFAHFHHDTELDLRLTRKLIAALGLRHPAGSTQHPTRSASSPWIELRYRNEQDVLRIVELVKAAITQL